MGFLIKILKQYKSSLDLIITQRRNRRSGGIFDNTNKLRKNTTLYKSRIGSYTDINKNTFIAYTDIGRYCNISWDVEICPRSHIYTNFTTHDFIYEQSEHEFQCNRPFNGYLNKIGHDVWIGCKSIILPGIEIGNGAIIAAGSVVTKSVPPYCIVGGNPAKFIKWRFDEETRNYLENLNWYIDEPEEIIRKKNEIELQIGFNLEEFKNNYLSRRRDLLTNERK